MMNTSLALLASLCLFAINGLILPMTKTDGSLDVSSLLSHIARLEQSLENKASVADVSKLENDLQKAKGGSTFTRWGRTSCPDDSAKVYKGYTGGTWYADKGGSSSVVCLPEDPIYAAHTTGHHDGSHVYGSEYETNYNGNPFQSLYQDDIPCVVCESSRSSSVMIPGRNECYPGWTMDYWGYLMGGYGQYASVEYICVDSQPEAIVGGKGDENGQIFYPVESRCGSLPCPPYHDYWELSCVVCSKQTLQQA